MKLFGFRIDKASYIDRLVSDAQNDAYDDGFTDGRKVGMIEVVRAKVPDGFFVDEESRAFVTGTGQYLGNTHVRDEDCDERCVIHNPSQHQMRNMPTHWRGDRGLMERICEHGVGHPDPDAMAFQDKMRPGHCEAVHGCDGCCGL